MNIVKNDIDSLNAEIKISLGPADYELKVSEGIKKIQKQSKMPGFRPGKVPGSLIKKQYGNQILVEEINKILNDAIYKFIERVPKKQRTTSMNDFFKECENQLFYNKK